MTIMTVQPAVRLPAVQGYFGPRFVTYTTQLNPASIETVIGHDPRSMHWKQLPGDIEHIYNHLQRATKKSRLDSLMNYIRYRFAEGAVIAGAFPAISIAIQNETTFKPIEEVPGVGELQLDLSRRNRRLVVDGLGRVSAALQLLELSDDPDLDPEEAKELRELVNSFTLPTVLYAPRPGTLPLKLEEMQQLFHDFNFRVTAVPERVAIALDHSDLYIGLANKIGESQTIKNLGGMETKAAGLGKKSTAIVVQATLVRFARAATEGEALMEESTKTQLKSPTLTEKSLGQFEEQIIDFIDGLVEGMTVAGFKDHDRVHLTAPGWGALGVIFHDLYVKLKVPDPVAAARRIGALDWRRSAPQWAEIMQEKTNKAGESFLTLAGGGTQNRRFILNWLREELGISERVKSWTAEHALKAIEGDDA